MQKINRVSDISNQLDICLTVTLTVTLQIHMHRLQLGPGRISCISNVESTVLPISPWLHICIPFVSSTIGLI